MAPSTPLAATALVALGGGSGAVLRYHMGRGIGQMLGPAAAAFPWATLAVNLLGSLLMGMLAASLARSADGETWRLLLGVGVLGGFTTFSAFSLELVALAERGAWASAAAYAVASVGGGAAGLLLGMAMLRA